MGIKCLDCGHNNESILATICPACKSENIERNDDICCKDEPKEEEKEDVITFSTEEILEQASAIETVFLHLSFLRLDILEETMKQLKSNYTQYEAIGILDSGFKYNKNIEGLQNKLKRLELLIKLRKLIELDAKDDTVDFYRELHESGGR